MVVNYASSKEGADRVVAEIAAKGGKAVAVQGDVSKPTMETALCRNQEAVWEVRHSGEQCRHL